MRLKKKRIKLVLALFFIAAQVPAMAQLKGGDFDIGGSISFNRQRGQLPDNPSNGILTKNFFRLAPQIGVFINRRWEGGFYTLVEYEGESSTLTLKDSAGKTVNFKEQGFELKFEFGFFIKHYMPINAHLYWVNSVQPNWGTFTQGDRLAALFNSDKPQQNRERFVATRWITQLQYFAKPNLAVSIGLNPLTYTYTYNTIVRSGQAPAKERGHNLTFNNIATGLFIGVNFIIISDNAK